MTLKLIYLSILSSQRSVAKQYISLKTHVEYWKSFVEVINEVQKMIEHTNDMDVVKESLRQMLSSARKGVKRKREQNKEKLKATIGLCEMLLER